MITKETHTRVRKLLQDRKRHRGAEVNPFLRLLETWIRLADVEREVLVEIAKRLEMGQRTYGELDLERDPRDFIKETGEELFDSVVYMACETVRKRKTS
jgi:hypothetical protein